jgi:hypothetical protein
MLECRRPVSQDTVLRARGVEGSDGATWDDLPSLKLTQTRDTSRSSRAVLGGDMSRKLRQEREEVAQSTDLVLDSRCVPAVIDSFSTPAVNECRYARSHESAKCEPARVVDKSFHENINVPKSAIGRM